MDSSEPSSWDVERRADGTILVRVHSCTRQGCQLPDAVFSFRRGDPQFDYWEQQLRNRSSSLDAGSGSNKKPSPSSADGNEC